MQSRKPPPGVYRDDPDRDDAASTSSAVPLRDHTFLDAGDDEELPSYTDEPGTHSTGHNQALSLGYDGGPFGDLVSNEVATLTTDDNQELSPAYNGGLLGDLVFLKGDTHCEASGSSTISIISDILTSDPKKLEAYIRFQSAIQPSPRIRITGTHTETKMKNNKKETFKVTDFDITIEVQDTLNPEWARLVLAKNDERTYRGGRIKAIRPGGRH